MKTQSIPFNKPHVTGKEWEYIHAAQQMGKMCAGGHFSHQCESWMEEAFEIKKVLLTHSGTAALEMIAILSNLKPGDEIIMPDYTFVSTANAFALRGIVPVFVDVRRDTLNLDETCIEQAITKKTKAIMTMHYAGVACEMDAICDIAKKHSLSLYEDAAQAFGAKYKQNYLGTIGDLAAMSFHETKNIISGEGGALFVNKPSLVDRSLVVHDVGTNRSKFFMGLVHSYTWVDAGSSYAPGDMVAAFLWAQLEHAQEITSQRLKLWNTYYNAFEDLESKEYIRRPIIPSSVTHNGHIFYILTQTREIRLQLMAYLKENHILAVTHYVPLHSSPGGKKFAKSVGSLKNSNATANTLIRLPLFYDMTHEEQQRIIEHIHDFFKKHTK